MNGPNLDRFLAQAELMSPSLVVRSRDQGFELLAKDQLVKRLACDLERQYREAKPAYWRYRTWQALCWQPIYLAMLAVHEYSSVINTSSITQAYRQLLVAGFASIKSGDFVVSNKINDMEKQQYQLLLADLYQYFQLLSLYCKLNIKICQRLMVDCGLYAIKALPNVSGHKKVVLAQSWKNCAANEIDFFKQINYAGYIELDSTNNDVEHQLEVKRDACCLHYLLEPKQICGNCPIY